MQMAYTRSIVSNGLRFRYHAKVEAWTDADIEKTRQFMKQMGAELVKSNHARFCRVKRVQRRDSTLFVLYTFSA